MCGFIAQLVEHRTGIAEVTGSNPVEALIFNWKEEDLEVNCEDHSLLSLMRLRCNTKKTKSILLVWFI